MKIGSLFSGAGGLDMAVEAVFGGEVIWQSEVDKAASTVLAHRFPGVPNLGDITQIDFRDVEKVDILCGGFPCQDVSAAGKRAGIKAGTRSGLWALFANAIDVVRPRLVVIENVRGLLSARAHRNLEPANPIVGDGSDGPVLRAAGAVLGDLADLRYDAIWATIAAADVGAPHRRERVFIVGRAVSHPGYDAGCPQQGVEHEVETCWVGQSGRGVSGHEPGVTLLPTPCAQQSGNSPEEHLRKKPGRKVVTNLAILVENGLLESGGAFLPTPQAHDSQGPKTQEQIAAMRAKGAGVRNLNETAVHELLSTPQFRDYKGRPSDGFNNANLCRDVALLCTPSASDGAGGKTSRSGGRIDEPLLGGQTREMSTAWGKYEPAIRRWESLTRPAPAPTEPNKNGNPRLSAAFSEWMMGWPHGWVTDPAIGISRNDQLRIIGNGVCPQQATAALTWLLQVAEVAA